MIGTNSVFRSALLVLMLLVGLGVQGGSLNLAMASEPEAAAVDDIQEDRSGEGNCSSLSPAVDSSSVLYSGGSKSLRDKDDAGCMCVPLPSCADDPVCPCVRYCQWI